MKTANIINDDYIKFLLKLGINLEYYDHVICTKEFIEKFKKTESLNFKFCTSGTSINYNGKKATLLFLWIESYSLHIASKKMEKIILDFSEAELEEIWKCSLKQTLIRLRKTDINLN